MPSMGQSFDCWYVIRASEYPCRLHIVLVSPCVSIHLFTSNDSLFHYPINIICSPWCIYVEISVLRSIQNRVLGSFWIFIIARAFNFWLCDPPVLSLTVGQYVVMIMVLTLLFTCSSIHYQQPRFLNFWPVAITLHDTSSTAIIDVPPLWNGHSEMVTRLYPVLILLIFNHPFILLYMLSFMGILLQLPFTSVSPMIAIPSFIMVFFKMSNLCWIGWYDALPIPPMVWSVILILPSLFPHLSWWPQSPQRLLLVFVTVMFGIPLWRLPGGCG